MLYSAMFQLTNSLKYTCTDAAKTYFWFHQMHVITCLYCVYSSAVFLFTFEHLSPFFRISPVPIYCHCINWAEQLLNLQKYLFIPGADKLPLDYLDILFFPSLGL